MKERYILAILFSIIFAGYNISKNAENNFSDLDNYEMFITSETATVEETSIVINETELVTEKLAEISETTVVETVEVEDITEEILDEVTETEILPLPETILDEINYQKKKYPKMSIAVGIYSLDGKYEYQYNEEALISGACTVKAVYAYFVLDQCQKQDIDIDTEYLTYKKGMKNDGSGIIKYSEYGTNYTISYLLEKLLSISDNTAYNILVSRFPLEDFQEFLDKIDGQQLYGRQYGVTSVLQRKNEWLSIYEYLNNNEKYSDTLRTYITNTKYCYITDWMKNEHNYMHKSGWCDGKNYTSASDCAIVDEKYLLIILTEDYSTGVAHTDVVRTIGLRVEEYSEFLFN